MSAAILRDQRVAAFMRAHDRIGAQRCKGCYNYTNLPSTLRLIHDFLGCNESGLTFKRI